MQTGSGYGAVNILTPLEAADQAVTWDARRSELEDYKATRPLALEAKKLALDDARLSSMVKTKGARQALLANAAALATTAEEWDAAMADLAGNGVTEAKQYVGRFSERLRNTVATAYSAPDPRAAMGAMNGEESPLSSAPQGRAASGASPLAAAGDMRSVFYGKSKEEIAQIAANLQKMDAALNEIANAPNPSAVWDAHAAELGHPHEVGQYTPQKLQQERAKIRPYLDYLGGRATMDQAGIPDTGPPPTLDDVGGRIYSIDRSNPNKPKVTPLTEREGSWTLVGTDDDGKGIYVNNATGEERTGGKKLSAKPGSGSGAQGSVFEAKREAWLAVHPGDAAGALDYANSLKGKNLSPDQAARAAAQQAQKDLDSLTLNGNPPPDAEAFLRQRQRELYTTFLTSEEPAKPNQPASATRGGYTPNQTATMQKFKGSKAAAGSADNPYVPTTEAQFNKLPRGSYYIRPGDAPGQVRGPKP